MRFVVPTSPRGGWSEAVLRHRAWLLLILYSAYGAVGDLGAAPAPSGSALLTNALQVLRLSREEAALARPARLRGVVTYADDAWKIWFVQDATAGVFLRRTNNTPVLAAGDQVEVEGVSEPGGFAPNILEQQVRVLSRGAFPAPDVLSFDELSGGEKDSQWIEVEAVVEGAYVEAGHLTLILMAPADLRAFIPNFTAQLSPSSLIDARVRLRGVMGTQFNQRRRLTGYRLWVPSVASLAVTRAAPLEASDIPVGRVGDVLMFNRRTAVSHRSKVHGVVTARASSKFFYLQDSSGGVRVHTRQTNLPSLGDYVEAIGFPQVGTGIPQLEESVVRVLGQTNLPAPARISNRLGMNENLDALLITLEGELVSKIPRGPKAELVLRVGAEFISAELEGTNALRQLDPFLPGSHLALTGVCSQRTGEETGLTRLQLILRSPDDLVVVRKPPWWTVERAMAVFGVTSILLLVWRVWGLRRESRLNDRYRQLIESAPDAIFVLDDQGSVLDVNPAACRMHGGARAKLVGMRVDRLMPPEDWKRVSQAAQVPLSEETVPLEEFRWRSARGPIPVELTVGRIVYATQPAILLIVRDVSERARAAEALRESEQRLQFALEASQTGAWHLDLLDHTAHRTLIHDRIFGYESLLPVWTYEMFLEHVLPEERMEVDRRFRIATASFTRWDFECRIRRKDGAIRWILAAGGPEGGPEGAPRRISGIVQDVTARKQAEEALEMMRFSVDHAGDSMFWIRRDGRILYVNHAACAERGYSLDELASMTIFDLAPDYDAEGWAEHFERVRRLGSLTLESRHRAKDGRWIQVEVNANYLDIGGQEMTFASVRDITARKQGELDRQKLEAQLRQSQKMEAIGTLAGGIAHDFNNILGCIVGNTELAVQDLDPDHPVVEFLGEIRQASARAAELVQQILSFGRQRQREARVLNLQTAVEEAARLLRSTLPAGVQLLTSSALDAPLIVADPTEIHQILLNLGTNAWHAMEGKPGCITLRIDPATVELTPPRIHADLQPGDYFRLTVTDSGKGMDAQTMERIFEPFFTTKEVGKGTGLGLFVVDGIVRSQKGAIVVRSQPGQGATFEVYLPAADVDLVVEPLPAPPSSSRSSPGRRVIYLDDESPLVAAATRLLERRGYQVSGFTRVGDALAALRMDPTAVDLIVTDYNMPGCSGLDVAREIRKINPRIPVILTSGCITDTVRLEAEALGIKRLMEKPFRVEDFCSTIDLILQEHKDQA